MVEVSDSPDEDRYVIKVDGQVAGWLDYHIRGDVFVALHTETDPAYSGQGLASTLVTQVLDRVRASGRRLRPLCPFVVQYLRRHPEYADLVAEDSRARDAGGNGAEESGS
jgi:uncharacterized protein